jgi:hypothetical protein
MFNHIGQQSPKLILLRILIARKRCRDDLVTRAPAEQSVRRLDVVLVHQAFQQVEHSLQCVRLDAKQPNNELSVHVRSGNFESGNRAVDVLQFRRKVSVLAQKNRIQPFGSEDMFE